jgi:hypothetical protein
MGDWAQGGDIEAARRVIAEIRRLEALAGLNVNLDVEPPMEGLAVAADEGGYHLVYWERGSPSLVRTDATLDDFLFALFSEATRRVDVPGIEHSDWRRRGFPKQLELLGKISRAWSERQARAQREELERDPFDDERYFRLALRNKLVAGGHAEAEADRLADERYPRPRSAGG